MERLIKLLLSSEFSYKHLKAFLKQHFYKQHQAEIGKKSKY